MLRPCFMSYKISTIEVFDRQARQLAKHYPSFRDDYRQFLADLQENPLQGINEIKSLGEEMIKLAERIRLQIHPLGFLR